MPLSIVPQHVKIVKVSNKNAKSFSERSTITEVQIDRAGSVLTQSPLSKTKVFPVGDVQPTRPSSTSWFPKTNRVSSHINQENPTATSPSAKSTRSKMLTIGLGILVSICALAGLAIGLYFLISNNMKTTSTTSTSTACTTGLCWATAGTTAFGTGTSSSNADHLSSPYHLVINSSSSFFVADCNNHRIQQFTGTSSIGTTAAGQANGQWGTTAYYLYQPLHLVIDSSGNLYVSDSQNHRVQYFASGSLLGVTVAGAGGLGSSGSALNQLNTPHGLAFDSSRRILYIADTNNHRIIAYSYGAVTGTVAAGGNGGGSLNNQLNSPTGIYLDVSSNSLYIANNNGHNILRWVVNASTWTLIAGNANGQSGSTSTTLSNPADLTFDYMGNLYVADSSNNRIQLFLSGSFYGTTIAGITSVAASASNTLSGPQSMALDSSLNLYVADTGNNRIQKFQRYY